MTCRTRQQAERITLPYWPRRMQARMAAAYCGVSKTKFLGDIGKKYPIPVKDGRNSLWYREDLDEALDLLREVGAPFDPFLEALNDRET